MKIRKISEFKAALKEHKEKNKLVPTHKLPSGAGFAIYDSINFVSVNAWNQVVPENKLLMRHPYLRAVENSSEKTHEHRYVLIYLGPIPVAAAVFNIIQIRSDDFGSVSKRTEQSSQMNNLICKIKDKAALRILIAGNIHLSGSHGFHYDKSLDSATAYHALAEAAYRIRQSEKKRGKIHIQLIKDFYKGEFECSNYLKNFKYRKFEVDPNMIVHIRDSWKHFDDYLADMKNKYRSRAKSVIKKGITLERRILGYNEIESYQERINILYENVAEKAKFRIVNIPAGYFYHLKKGLKDEFEFLGYFLNGVLVGFTCSIFWGENCEGHTIGLDYEFNNKHAIYQNILYDDIKMAIKKGKKYVIFGRTALEIKSAVGAQPAKMQCFIRHPNSISNKLLKPVFRHIKTSEWTPRSPFKD